MTKDTKGVRQVLERLNERISSSHAKALREDEYSYEDWQTADEAAYKEALATLQEIMLGMLPEKKKLEGAKDSPKILWEANEVIAYNAALSEMKHNIRGGFNNG